MTDLSRTEEQAYRLGKAEGWNEAIEAAARAAEASPTGHEAAYAIRALARPAPKGEDGK